MRLLFTSSKKLPKLLAATAIDYYQPSNSHFEIHRIPPWSPLWHWKADKPSRIDRCTQILAADEKAKPWKMVQL